MHPVSEPEAGRSAPRLTAAERERAKQNEALFAARKALRPILVRNNPLPARALATLPVVGKRTA